MEFWGGLEKPLISLPDSHLRDPLVDALDRAARVVP